MIQVYKRENTSFHRNGDMTLLPTTCTIDTSTWELTMNHPIDDEGRWKYIIEDAVIKAPSFNGEQLFRIYKKMKQDSGVEAVARPIFFDAKDDCTLLNVKISNKTGQQALNMMMDGTKYSGQSNIKAMASTSYELKNLMEAISGDDENSFINRWGGEVLYDNYKVIIHDKIGSDRGVSLLYGKNIPVDGISEEIDMSDLVTRIIPKAHNGYMLEGQTPWVDSPLVNHYPKVRTKVIEFSDIKLKADAQEDEDEGVIVCETLADVRLELRKRCKKEFATGIDKPKVMINADMVLLQNTLEYENYQFLETVSKGDIIHCCHDKLGIVTDARVVDLVYDCMMERVDSVVIGDITYDYISDTMKVMSSASQTMDTAKGRVFADKIVGTIDPMKTQFKYQKDMYQRQDVRAILFEDMDPTSSMYGAIAIGSQGIQIANTRTRDGSDWEWRTFGNGNGFSANEITMGILKNILIEGSTIEEAVINDGMIRNSTIQTDKDIVVGSNIMIGKNQNSSMNEEKCIQFTESARISRSVMDSEAHEALIMQARDRITLQVPSGSMDTHTSIHINDIDETGSSITMSTPHTDVTADHDSLRLRYFRNNLEKSIKMNLNGTQVSGGLRVDNVAVTSDLRLKENIEDIDLRGVLDILTVKKYNLIGDNQKTVGVIAQDFLDTPYEDIILRKDVNGYYAVNYDVILLAIAQKMRGGML